MVTPDSIAIYVHIPFCVSICPYCDFDRQATGFDRVDVYLEAVRGELLSYKSVGLPAHSLFFGGGTPSLLNAEQVESLIRTVQDTFALSDGAEVTLECNPGDATPEKMRAFRAAGVTRLSIGVQSLDDRLLPVLGRRHSAAQAREACAWARKAGLDVSLDLMYGLPDQTLDHWASTLEQVLELDPQHLSCYLLTLDERVPMGRDVARGRLTLPSDDCQVDMHTLARARLAQAGYRQYEISNWARPGQESRHNLTYWRDGWWLGAGAGAASSYQGRRWKNTPVVDRYVRSIEQGDPAERVEDEVLDAATALRDALTLGLRLREGVNADRFADRFGRSLAEALGREGADLVEGGLLEWRGGSLRVADEHQLVTNEILVRLTTNRPDRLARDAALAGSGAAH